jgi:uncharacterized membrane protein SpoIIM required for sporulation
VDRSERFVRTRAKAWDAFERSLAAAGRSGTVPADRVVAFARAYRDLAADLSAARAMGCTPATTRRLNVLVSRAHAVVYRGKASPTGLRRRGALARVLVGLPRAFTGHPRTCLLVLALFLVPALLAFLYVAGEERRIHEVFPSLANVIRPEDGGPARTNVMPATGSSNYMIHNSLVGLRCLAFGMLLGLGTAWFLVLNGTLLGALAAHFHNQGALASFWPQILPHGVTEFLGMFAAAQAGFLLARAIWAPGEYSRRDALAMRGREAGLLAFATVLLMIWSGFVESYLTRSTTNDALRMGFAALALAAVASWFLLALRVRDPEGATAGARP